jgi:hypothetical protein
MISSRRRRLRIDSYRPKLECLENRELLSFSAAVNYPTGGILPVSVAVGDFNNDGTTDLAVANLSSNNVSILEGNGDGTFQAPRTIAVGSEPRAVVAWDLTGDGNVDLVVANQVSNTISVLLGNGDGTFKPAVNYAVGATPVDVALSDLKGDGTADLVVANYGSGTVSVLLGNGDGSFQRAVNYAVGSGPYGVNLADLNSDGIPDLAVANRNGGSVSILLGNGDGTFQPQQVIRAGSGPFSIEVADLNADGNADLAVANENDHNVSVLLGNGDGTFKPPTNYFVGSEVLKVAAEDFTGSGNLDLVTDNYGGGGGNTVSLLLSNGDGTFQSAQHFTVQGGPAWVATADLTDSGFPDLIAANSTSNTVSILLNQADWLAPSKGGGQRGDQFLHPLRETSVAQGTPGSADISPLLGRGMDQPNWASLGDELPAVSTVYQLDTPPLQGVMVAMPNGINDLMLDETILPQWL